MPSPITRMTFVGRAGVSAEAEAGSRTRARQARPPRRGVRRRTGDSEERPVERRR
jgi:hypothetical protein